MIVVTGAGGSLGPYVARRLHDAGHELALVDLDVAALEGLPGTAHAIDLLDEDAAHAWAAGLPGVTGVVHAVGGWRGGAPLSEAPAEDWEALHGPLVRTVQHTTRAFAPALQAAGDQGRFVLCSGRAALAPTSTNAAYAAAKAAAEAWTLAFADELSQTRGTANVLVVNAILTEEMRAADPDKPYRTFTHAAHMADAIAFLLSDSAGAMNGQRLHLHS